MLESSELFWFVVLKGVLKDGLGFCLYFGLWDFRARLPSSGSEA